MSTGLLGLLIECLVAVLLITTIFYCVILNRRLTRLRSDEEALRGTIAELVTAVGMAERAIESLKVTTAEAEASLGSRLAEAETRAEELGGQIEAGRGVLGRICQITEAAARHAPAPAQAPVARERVPFHRMPGAAA